jgi:hypothetical protein
MSNLCKGTVLESFQQLEQGLRDWSSFVDPQTDDAGGMMTLLCACLENLRMNVPSEQLTDLGAALTDEERSLLKVLAESM